eukprot:1210714-Pleurochrysis_carterae.AAC.3
MEPDVFDPLYTATQLRHTGMLQCCEMLKHGYPTRINYAEVKARYEGHMPADVRALRLKPKDFAAAVLYGLEVPRHLYQLGESRLFFTAGGVATLDEVRACDMSVRGDAIAKRVRRWVVLRRYARALAHVRMGNQLQWLLRRVRALRAWRAALSFARVYNRGMKRLVRKATIGKRAARIQATARMRAPRRAFLEHAKELYAARRAAESARAENAAAVAAQAVARGVLLRRGLRREQAAAAEAALAHTKASVLQALFRGARERKERARRLEQLLLVLTPNACVVQRWWRAVRGEMKLRKLRSVIDRYTEGHRALITELSAMRAYYDEAAAAGGGAKTGGLGSGMGIVGTSAGRGRAPSLANAKRFEMWISLKVGLPDDAKGVIPAFAGYQVFSARSAALRGAGGYFAAFFSDASNVDLRDADGHYAVHRSWKHFDAILDYIRDGACTLPTAYVPSTYDNRPASTEESELLEFLREAHFYKLSTLVDMAMPKLLNLKYGANAQMLALLRGKRLL